MAPLFENIAFHDLPQKKFPFDVYFMNRLGVVIHTIHVDGAGVMQIPPLSRSHGPVQVSIHYADGEVVQGNYEAGGTG